MCGAGSNPRLGTERRCPRPRQERHPSATEWATPKSPWPATTMSAPVAVSHSTGFHLRVPTRPPPFKTRIPHCRITCLIPQRRALPGRRTARPATVACQRLQVPISICRQSSSWRSEPASHRGRVDSGADRCDAGSACLARERARVPGAGQHECVSAGQEVGGWTGIDCGAARRSSRGCVARRRPAAVRADHRWRPGCRPQRQAIGGSARVRCRQYGDRARIHCARQSSARPLYTREHDAGMDAATRNAISGKRSAVSKTSAPRMSRRSRR